MSQVPSSPDDWSVGAVSHLEAVDEEFVARLVFRVGGHAVAHEPERVGELIRQPPVHRVPNAPGVLAGLLNSRGRVVPVYDIRHLLPASGDAAPRAGTIEWILVFHDHEEGDDAGADDCVGLVIDEMPLRMRLTPTHRLAGDELPELFRPWCRFVHEHERSLYGEIDMVAMVESIRNGAESGMTGRPDHPFPDRTSGPNDQTISSLPAAGMTVPSMDSDPSGAPDSDGENDQ